MNCDHSRIKEACGVFGIYTSSEEQAANPIYYGLSSLQHRGQESCGIAVCDTCGSEGNLNVHRGMGLVHEVFDDNILHSLTGNLGVGHVRYSTTGETSLQNAQPLVLNYVKGTLALCTQWESRQHRRIKSRTCTYRRHLPDNNRLGSHCAPDCTRADSHPLCRRGNSAGCLKNKRSLWANHCKSEKTDRRQRPSRSQTTLPWKARRRLCPLLGELCSHRYRSDVYP